jgi:hypothetical protein
MDVTKAGCELVNWNELTKIWSRQAFVNMAMNLQVTLQEEISS